MVKSLLLDIVAIAAATYLAFVLLRLFGKQ